MKWRWINYSTKQEKYKVERGDSEVMSQVYLLKSLEIISEINNKCNVSP